MDLKTFVSQTIVEISEGITDAQGKDLNTIINPKVYPNKGGQVRVCDNSSVEYATLVSFDVCVTAQETDSSDGHAGIKVFAMNAGCGLSSETMSQSTSRIKFEVPVIFPRK